MPSRSALTQGPPYEKGPGKNRLAPSHSFGSDPNKVDRKDYKDQNLQNKSLASHRELKAVGVYPFSGSPLGTPGKSPAPFQNVSNPSREEAEEAENAQKQSK